VLRRPAEIAMDEKLARDAPAAARDALRARIEGILAQ